MKRKLFSTRYLLFFLVTTLGVASIFTSCSSEKDDPVITYTVSFKTNSSTVLNAKKIEKGKAVTKPNAPSKSGYTFKDWYTTEDTSGTPYVFSTAVTGSFTLYAKFVAATDTRISLTALKDLIAECNKPDVAKCKELESVNTSNITDMSRLFKDFTDFNTNIRSWDTSSVTDMSYMFNGASSFNQPLNSWDISKVDAMQSMFANATNFNQPLNDWDTHVTKMRSMFAFATSFNQPLDNWKTGNVTTMAAMFYGATNFNQNLSKWDVKKVITHGNFNTKSALENPDYLPDFQ